MCRKLRHNFNRYRELVVIVVLLILLVNILKLYNARNNGNEASGQLPAQSLQEEDVMVKPLLPPSSNKLPRERVHRDGIKTVKDDNGVADDDANAFVNGKPRKAPAKVAPIAPPEGSEENPGEKAAKEESGQEGKVANPAEKPSARDPDDAIGALGENGKPKKKKPMKTTKTNKPKAKAKPKSAADGHNNAAENTDNSKANEDAAADDVVRAAGAEAGVKAENFKRNCSAVENIYMLKVHKSGSTTLQNILWRLGFERNLRMLIFPKGFPYPHLKYHETYAPPTAPDYKGVHNIMTEHSIYHPPAIKATMPKNTKNIAILREPLAQLRSAAEYYGIVHKLVGVDRNVSTDHVLKTFLTNPTKYENHVVPPDMYKVRNHVINMFGYEDWHNVDNPPEFDKFMRRKDAEFFVLILERMTESLVLLRREMCWSFKQILTLPMRAAKTKGEDDEEDSVEDLEMEYRDYNPGDYGVYDFFIRKIGYRIDDIVDKDDFWAEVRWFTALQGKTDAFCKGICRDLKGLSDRALTKKLLSKSISFAASAWDGSFKVDGSDCLLMMFDPYVFRNAVKVKNYPQLCDPDRGGPNMDPRWTIPPVYCEKDYYKYTIPWDIITNPKSYVHPCL